MPSLWELCDSAGHVLCRYCLHAEHAKDANGPYLLCHAGDNPGRLSDPDCAECKEGEMVHESDLWEREHT